MRQSIVSLEYTLNNLARQGNIVWDFEDSPHLFPVYVFLHFKDKYCITENVEGIRIDFFDLNYAFCKCVIKELPECFSVWIRISRSWETATTFTYIIGDANYVPFKNKTREYATISLSVNTYDGDAGTDILPHCFMRDCDFEVLNASIKVSTEIQDVMKQSKVNFQTKAP